MKILIEESVLRQTLETFTHCYAKTDRRINERAKLLVELRTALNAAEQVEPFGWYTLTQCEIAQSLITVVRHALYDEEYDRAMDEATELIKAGMAIRDAIFRITHTSGVNG